MNCVLCLIQSDVYKELTEISNAADAGGFHKYVLALEITVSNARLAYNVSIYHQDKLYHAIEVGNVSHRGGGQHKYHAVKQ